MPYQTQTNRARRRRRRSSSSAPQLLSFFAPSKQPTTMHLKILDNNTSKFYDGFQMRQSPLDNFNDAKGA
jgi:hypothetical protein